MSHGSGPRPTRAEAGVTLVEVVVTMSLFLTVSGAILGVFESFNGAQANLESRLVASQSLRAATDQLAADLRAARGLVISEPARAGQVLELRRGEGSSAEVVRYQLGADGSLTRRAGAGSRLLLTGVDPASVVFRYLDADGSELDPRREDRIVVEGCSAVVRVDLVARVGRSGLVSGQRAVSLRNRDVTTPC